MAYDLLIKLTELFSIDLRDLRRAMVGGSPKAFFVIQKNGDALKPELSANLIGGAAQRGVQIVRRLSERRDLVDESAALRASRTGRAIEKRWFGERELHTVILSSRPCFGLQSSSTPS